MLFTLQIDEILGGFLFLGDTITRYMSHIYILMGMRDGLERRKECEAAGRAEVYLAREPCRGLP